MAMTGCLAYASTRSLVFTQALTDSCPDAKKECCEITKKVLSANRPMGRRKFPHNFRFDITKNGKAQLNDQKSFGSMALVGNHPRIAKKSRSLQRWPVETASCRSSDIGITFDEYIYICTYGINTVYT